MQGSGRFNWRRWPACGPTSRLNPLHCGAVVASGTRHRVCRVPRRVSIPFIAGQWSLHERTLIEALRNALVSIPFIAGQWSLQKELDSAADEAARVSIPFIAGQWSLRMGGNIWTTLLFRFNPLHCGAVVASPIYIKNEDGRMEFQSPSLRGSGRFPLKVHRLWWTVVWEFQSPSLRGSGRFNPGQTGAPGSAARFNPLHCGAVVASSADVAALFEAMPEFQSPSLRGSGRFALKEE